MMKKILIALIFIPITFGQDGLTISGKIIDKVSGCGAARLAHLLWEQGVEGSNPFTPT